MVDWLNPSEDALAGLYAGRNEMRDIIENLEERIEDLENENDKLKEELEQYKKGRNG